MKAFTSVFKLLICSCFESFTTKSTDSSQEVSETGRFCVWIGIELAGVSVTVVEVVPFLCLLLLLEWLYYQLRILKCSSITPFGWSTRWVSSAHSLSQLLAVKLLVCANKRSTVSFFANRFNIIASSNFP